MKKKYGLVFSLLMMFTVLLNLPTATFAQTNDPNSVIKGMVAALNASDIEATLGYFADDALVTETQPGTDQITVRNGKAQIRGMYQEATAWKPQVTLLGEPKLDGDKVVATLRFSAPPDLQAAGMQYFDFAGELLVQNGKIKSMRSGMTDETMANIQTAMSKAQVPQSPAPTTSATTVSPVSIGKEGNWSIWWLVAGGVVVLFASVAGVLLVRRSPTQSGK